MRDSDSSDRHGRDARLGRDATASGRFVAGAGLMGHGIAQALAATGSHVALYEPDLARANAGARPDRRQPRAVRREGPADAAGPGGHPRPDRPTDELAAARDADLVVEAVFEDVAVKTRLWTELDGLAPADAIFATEHVVDLDRPAGRRSRPDRRRRGSSACTSSARFR